MTSLHPSPDIGAKSASVAVSVDSRLRRSVDIVVATTGLALSWPMLVVLVAAVRLSSRGPAIYRQTRVGRDEQPFKIWKFRTMIAEADRDGPMVSGRADPRVTPLGRRLRSSRLDELPQLVNLLRGDVTLIGPRPEVLRFLDFYTGDERQLLRVRPGVIGPGALLFATAQADELDDFGDPDGYYTAHHLHPKLALDLDYLRDRTLRRDLELIARAVGLCAAGGPRKLTSGEGV
ncbi:MAG: sugar transferase [Actinomycetota bacterium]|nr:sugar transferase [Actinomycetota bacterium]